MNIKQRASAGRELYQAIWEKLGTHFYDLSRLTDWSSWKHRYDDKITDDQSALLYARVMVASLKDNYTCILEPNEVESMQERWHSSESAVIAERLCGNIGFLYIDSFSQENIVEQVAKGMTKIAGCGAFLVVVQNNLGGLAEKVIECLELFVEEGPIVSFESRTEAGWTNDYRYFAPDASILCTLGSGSEEQIEWFKRMKAITAGKPTAVVINGDTASAAEIFAAAILDNGKRSGLCRSFGSQSRRNGKKSTLSWSFGTRSLGKGIAQDRFEILDGRATVKISTGRAFSPNDVWLGDGGQTVCNGIVPDFVVEGDEEAIDVACRYLRHRLRLVKIAAYRDRHYEKRRLKRAA